METNIGITKKNRQAVSSEMSKLLADEFILYKREHYSLCGNI
jgi:hypothetical protein